ncbi:MAG: nucleoside monophosphate kinase, partial [Croceibacterium sp.]
LRAAVAAQTPVGIEAKAVMDRGELVSDAIVSALIDDELVAMGPQVGAIFDGYPRTAAQAEALDAILERLQRRLDHVIELEVDEDELVRRIVGRYSCATCGEGYHDVFKQPAAPGVCDRCGGTEFKRRPDDNEETVRTRMAEYRAKTAPILPLYEARGIVCRVDGMAPIDAISQVIEGVLART